MPLDCSSCSPHTGHQLSGLISFLVFQDCSNYGNASHTPSLFESLKYKVKRLKKTEDWYTLSVLYDAL